MDCNRYTRLGLQVPFFGIASCCVVLFAFGAVASVSAQTSSSGDLYERERAASPSDWFYLDESSETDFPSLPSSEDVQDRDVNSSSRWFFDRFSYTPEDASPSLDQLLEDGRVELDGRRYENAQRYFERVIALGPESVQASEARRHLAELYQGPPPAAVRGDVKPLEFALPPRVVDDIEDEFISAAGDRVFFSQGSDKLGVRARSVLRAQARYLNGVGRRLGVLVLGYVDDGALVAKDADDLSNRRAKAVRDVLIAEGIDDRRIVFEGRGRSERIAECPSALCQAQNRRVVSVLLQSVPTQVPATKRAGNFSSEVSSRDTRAATQ